MHMADILETLAQGRDLTQDEARAAFAALMDGELSAAQAGAFLMGLRAKGETAQELAAGVETAVARTRKVDAVPGPRVDTCGTGGDHSCSFNCSTAVALTLAGMGYTVVKHGNRSVSSKCGSADVVEGLGLPMPAEPDQAAAEIQARKFVFLFAPYYHPAFKHIMPVRKEMGVRTLFNLMGPLLNPARPTHQLLGVARADILHLMAEALLLSGVEKAAVVHGAGGFDELTPFGPAHIVWVGGGKLVEAHLDPAELGFAPCEPAEVTVEGPQHALETLQAILAGKGPQPMQEMAALNLAVALHLLDEGSTLSGSVKKAREAIRDGAGQKVLANLDTASQGENANA